MILRSRKRISWSFRRACSMMWYAHRSQGSRAVGHQVRGVVAASERASAAVGAGDRGATVGPWRSPRWRRGGCGEDPLPAGRARRAGGGRKRVSAHDRDLVAALLALVEPDERGDPMSPLRWTTESLRHLAEELTRQGHPVSAPTVGRLLRENGFSLQGTAKTLEG